MNDSEQLKRADSVSSSTSTSTSSSTSQSSMAPRALPHAQLRGADQQKPSTKWRNSSKLNSPPRSRASMPSTRKEELLDSCEEVSSEESIESVSFVLCALTVCYSSQEEACASVLYTRRILLRLHRCVLCVLSIVAPSWALFVSLIHRDGLVSSDGEVLVLEVPIASWHNSASLEAHFWSVQSMLALSAILFIDSPLAWGSHYPSTAAAVILATGLVVQVYNRLLDMRQMTPLLPATWDGTSPLPFWQAAKLLDKDIQSLMYRFSFFSRLSRFALIERERAIVEQIRKLTNKEQLNYVLRHINFPQLLDVVKDHKIRFRGVTGNLRTELMNLLCDQKLPLLDMYTKAILLNALLKFGLRAHRQAQAWATILLLSVEGNELSALKGVLDNYSEYYSLHYLVYHGLVDASLRARVLDHIAAHSSIPSTRHSPGSKRPLKILSDIDDTLACSGGVFPAGVDYRFPKNTVYPGVLAFYRELDLGDSIDDTEHDGSWEKDRLGNIVFLSARPHIYKDNSEEQSYKKFRKLRQLTYGLHANPVLLVGDLKGFSITWGDMLPIMNKKYDNFVEYAKLYPEFNFVLVGDNGQGDYAFALRALASHGKRVKAAFIHRVRPRKLTFGYSSGEVPSISFFATYVGAALIAWQRGLIHRSGVGRVIESARREMMESLVLTLSPATWNERAHELNEEIKEANLALNTTLPPIARGDEPIGFIQ